MTAVRRLAVILLVGLAVSSCASPTSISQYGAIGTRIDGASLVRENPLPFRNPVISTTAIGWASSGGGSRAAYLNAAVLREIHHSGLRIDLPTGAAKPASLLEQIDFVSAVSGGALSATYWVANLESLKGDINSQAWAEFLEKMAENYRQRQWYLLGILNPATWARVLFTSYNRGHIARNDYDDRLFHGRAIADLPQRPVLYVNAFDVGNRVRFVFSSHFIETGYYEEKGWTNKLGAPRGLASANDMVFTRIDPRSVRLSDAVYASSAFPFAYPNMALMHFGNKIAYQGSLIFLADGGLVDNSGLLTLMTQMRIEVGRSPKTRLVLAVHLDASVDSFTQGTVFQRQGIEDEYAWRDTYLGHGRAAVEGAINNYEGTILKFLEATGVVVDDLVLNYEGVLTNMSADKGRNDRTSWLPEFGSRKLVLRPLVISLRLRDIADAYYQVWNAYSETARPPSRLAKLFEESDTPSGFDEMRRGTWPADTFRELQKRLSVMTTDFTLTENDRKVLDLAAYLLVHGKLRPALNKWNEVARARLEPAN